MNDDGYIKTYIGKFEGLLIEHIRKQVDSETKNSIYHSALQELQAKNEELERTCSDQKEALNQALNGLHAVTIEKNSFKENLDKLTEEHRLLFIDLDNSQLEHRASLNQVAILEQTIEELNIKLSSVEAAASQLKSNYDLVLNELATFKEEKVGLKPTKKIKSNTVDNGSEWVDGN